MMRLLKPRKTTLLFVIRDKSKTPMNVLVRQINEMMDKIWSSISKPKVYKDAKYGDFLDVKAFGLASYEQNEDLFKAQVEELKQFLSTTLSAQLANHGQEFDGSEFALGTEQAWKIIQDEKSLHLPNIKEVVSTLGCKEVAEEVLNGLAKDKDWSRLENALQSRPLPGSGERLARILKIYLSKFDEETLHFDATIKTRKRQQLENDAWQLVQPAYSKMLEHIYITTLQVFENGLKESLNRGKSFAESVRQCRESCLLWFNEECADESIFQAQSDASDMREKLCHSINECVARLQHLKLDELLLGHKRQFTESIAQSLSLFSVVGKDTWAEIRNTFKLAKMESVKNLSIELSNFELAQEDRAEMVRDLEKYTREDVVRKIREESGKAKAHMMNRFSTVFRYDENSKLRKWTWTTNIKKITKKALREALECLSVMAVIRLDETRDNVKNLLSCLMDDRLATNSLDSVTWEGVPPKNTLIRPVECKTLWIEFLLGTKDVIDQARAERELNLTVINLALEMATAAMSVVTAFLNLILPS